MPKDKCRGGGGRPEHMVELRTSHTSVLRYPLMGVAGSCFATSTRPPAGRGATVDDASAFRGFRETVGF